jgi:hypothetical protein
MLFLSEPLAPKLEEYNPQYRVDRLPFIDNDNADVSDFDWCVFVNPIFSPRFMISFVRSLPNNVTMSPNAWIRFGEEDKVQFFGNTLKIVDSSWKEIEVSPGVYRFNKLKDRILEVSEGGKYGIELHIKAAVWDTKYIHCNDRRSDSCLCASRCSGTCEFRADDDIRIGAVPDFIVDYYDVAIHEEVPKCDAPKAFRIVNVDIFNHHYHKKYAELLGKLGESGIPSMPQVVVAYVHAPSLTRGEEGDHLPNDGPDYEMFKERLDAWAVAFGEHRGKLVFVRRQGALLQHAIALGMGERNGFVEDYVQQADNELICQRLTSDHYMSVIEQCPIIVDGRMFGDENEEYAPSWQSRFGDVALFPHRYRESMLRVLQMRRNFLWTAVCCFCVYVSFFFFRSLLSIELDFKDFTLNAPLLAYVALSLGKRINESVDAWYVE